MRRLSFLGSVVALALVGLLVPEHAGSPALAQEGTSVAEVIAPPEGVAFEPLTVVQGVALPNRGNLIAVRVVIEPGAVLPTDPADPSVALLFLYAGEVTVRIDAPLTFTRADPFASAQATADAGGAFVSPQETAPAGEAVRLRAGDAALLPANIGGEIRNDGQERTVGLGFLVFPAAAGQVGATLGA